MAPQVDSAAKRGRAMYLDRAWYVAAWDHEITRVPLPRMVLGRPVVFWRTGDGRAVALEDRCCHRHAPLSVGTVTGDAIRCGYHGLVFDRAGQCIEVPEPGPHPAGRAGCAAIRWSRRTAGYGSGWAKPSWPTRA